MSVAFGMNIESFVSVVTATNKTHEHTNVTLHVQSGCECNKLPVNLYKKWREEITSIFCKAVFFRLFINIHTCFLNIEFQPY